MTEIEFNYPILKVRRESGNKTINLNKFEVVEQVPVKERTRETAANFNCFYRYESFINKNRPDRIIKVTIEPERDIYQPATINGIALIDKYDHSEEKTALCDLLEKIQGKPELFMDDDSLDVIKIQQILSGLIIQMTQ